MRQYLWLAASSVRGLFWKYVESLHWWSLQSSSYVSFSKIPIRKWRTLAQSLKHLVHVLIRCHCTSLFKGHIRHIIIWIWIWQKKIKKKATIGFPVLLVLLNLIEKTSPKERTLALLGRGAGVNMITDVLYNINMYILFCVKCFELSDVMNTAPYKCCVSLFRGQNWQTHVSPPAYFFVQNALS